jgi:hypothetical protein
LIAQGARYGAKLQSRPLGRALGYLGVETPLDLCV